MKITSLLSPIASLVLVLAQALLASSVARHNLGNPVAIDRASDSAIYVLSADREVRRFAVSGERIVPDPKGQFPVVGSPVDFTYSRFGQVESLFICSINLGKGVISRYSLEGKVIGSWWLWHPCGGLDYDPTEQILYFGTTDTREIYRIDIKSDRGPESLGLLPPMEKMGPVALDHTRKILYVGDISGGALFEFNLATRSSRTLTSEGAHFGTIAALYVDLTSQSLCIVDGVAQTVLSTKLGSPSPSGQQTSTASRAVSRRQNTPPSGQQTHIIVHDPQLINPSGVVPLDRGRYLVSDYEANALFLVSADGKIVARFP
jgi:hypothetical protein